MQDYIAAHQMEEINLSDLADSCDSFTSFLVMSVLLFLINKIQANKTE